MAGAAATLGQLPFKLESDTTGYVLTKGNPTQKGKLWNYGPADVFTKVTLTNQTAATVAGIVTAVTQTEGIADIPADGYLEVSRSMQVIAHKTAAGTATLQWIPEDDF